MADFEAHLPLPQVVDLDYAFGYPESYKRGTLPGLTSRWTNGSLMLSPIIAQVKSSRVQIEKAMISCLGTEADLYVFIGNDPLPNTASVPAAYIRNGRVRVM